jgi:acylphosphatase
MADVVRRRVIVRGEVQGVFFRDSTRKQAESEGVSGWVRNRDDGSVEAVFEGPPAAVEAMVEWCRSGPSRAEVEDMDVILEEDPDALEGFRVR